MVIGEHSLPGFAALEVDQLGNARPVNTLCDIGAIELSQR
jgi:hypothetical protein